MGWIVNAREPLDYWGRMAVHRVATEWIADSDDMIGLGLGG